MYQTVKFWELGFYLNIFERDFVSFQILRLRIVNLQIKILSKSYTLTYQIVHSSPSNTWVAMGTPLNLNNRSLSNNGILGKLINNKKALNDQILVRQYLSKAWKKLKRVTPSKQFLLRNFQSSEFRWKSKIQALKDFDP